MTGFLRSRGLRVQQCRLREAMRRVDPAKTLLRARTIDSCQYSEFQGVDLYIQNLTFIERAQ